MPPVDAMPQEFPVSEKAPPFNNPTKNILTPNLVGNDSLKQSPQNPILGPPILEFAQVTKSYGPVIGVNHVSLELRGGITGLVGANGAGKSTLLRLAGGQLRPNLGEVKVNGLSSWDWRAKKYIGYCPDSDAFFEEMTGFQFVETIARLNGYKKIDTRERTERVLEQVGMKDRAYRRIRGYSKGMRQRIKLAQALLTDPVLCILDEPLSGIDPIGRQELLQLFQSLAEAGKCLLISSHELEALEKLTNHIIIMVRGRIAAVGTLTEIRDLLANQPLAIRIDSDQIRTLAGLLVQSEDVVEINLQPDFLTSAKSATNSMDRSDGRNASLVVRVINPLHFFQQLSRWAIEECIEIRHLEALDDSAHAVLGYLLGGSGKT